MEHTFIPFNIRNNEEMFNRNNYYFICKNCNLIVYNGKNCTDYLVSHFSMNKLGSNNRELKHFDFTCDDILIRNIIE